MTAPTTPTMTVALLGLGTMGSGMAANLLKAGFPLTVWNRTAGKAEPFATQGARVASDPADAARGAQVVIAMLADDHASREAWLGAPTGTQAGAQLGQNGALETAAKGAVLVECSTVSPAWVAELAALAADRGLSLLDAPVTGSRPQAAAGQLSLLVGGSESALDQVRPALEAVSKAIVYLGPSGSGAKLKLINNFLCGVQAASLAEALTWIERSGLDVTQSLDFLKAAAPGSPLLTSLSARMTSRDYAVNFFLKLMTKDLLYAQAAAAEAGVDLTTAANARALFERAIGQGRGDEDMAAIIEPIRAS